MRSPIYLAIAAAAASPGGSARGSTAGAGEAAALFLLPMAALDVPIVENHRSDGRLRLKLVLRVADEAGLTRLRDEMPALREVTLATASEFAQLYATPYAPVNARRLVRDLSTSLHAHDPAIRSVLLVEVAAVRR